jgi:hypothetical protein
MAYTTIKKPSDYFNTKLYTGNGTAIGSGGNAITGVGFQPDWTWIKRRDGGTSHHQLFDAVRGATKRVYSSSNSAESTDSETLTAFGTDGFTVGSNTGVNPNGNNLVAWNWKANGAGSANTDGSISSTVSASATSGFSIVKYTGTGANATVGHGLGVAPKMIIVKNTEATENWLVYHQSLENTSALKLNETSAKGSTQYYWNNTSPTSSTFSLGASSEANTNADVNIAYCFADVTGYSKFGSYTGNGNADGTFVYTGFKPAFVIHKRTDTGASWMMYDNKRQTINPKDQTLFADLNNAESGGDAVDFLSNGFKQRSTGASQNASGGTYIYMAFAEQPLIGDNPATAR